MDNFHAPTLGLVEMPELGELLRTLGYRVISGNTFPEAAAAVKVALEDAATSGAPSFPLLVADVHRPGIKAWTQKVSRTSPVLILRAGAEEYIVSADARSITLPATVAEILATAGLPASSDSRLGLTVAPNGSLIQAAPAVDEFAAAVVPPFMPADEFTDSFTAPFVDEFTAPAAPAAVPTVAPVAPHVPAAAPAAHVADAAAAAADAAPARAPWDTRPAAPVADAAPTIAPQPVFDRAEQTMFPDPAPVAPALPVAPVASATPTSPAWAPAALPIQVPRPQGRRALPVEPDQTSAPAAPAPSAPAPVVQPATAAEPSVPAWVPAPAAPVEPTPAPTFVAPVAPVAVPEPQQAPAAPAWAVARAAPAVAPATPVAAPATPVAVPVAEPVVEPTSPAWAVVPDTAPAPAPQQAPQQAPQSAPVITNFFAAPAAALPETSSDDLFDARPSSAAPAGVPYVQPKSHGRAPVIFSWAYKGGVNKTSLSLQLAERAAEAGLRVWLIDMNRGQGGVRTVLRISDTANIRSAFDAARLGDPSRAFVKPDEANTFRPANLPPIKFGLVLAPPRAEADPAQTPYPVYQAIINHARATADLVIIDTQTVEAVDNSGLISNVMVPMMAGDAWGLAITAFAKESVENLKAAFTAYRLRGLTRDRQLLVVTRARQFLDVDAAGVETTFQQFANFAGTTDHSDFVKEQFDKGIVETDDPAVRPLLDAVLLRVTGDSRFESAAPKAPKAKRFSLFGGRK